MVRCNHCGAGPGIACHVTNHPRRRLGVVGPSRSHPSRLEAAA
ncbi:zinc finger domain-containing protein [Pimelobacter simplex]